jgi:glycerol uptake facilitator-like aquaporin
MIGNVKHGNFDRVLGFCYILVQFLGGFIGAVFGSIYSRNSEMQSSKIELAL